MQPLKVVVTGASGFLGRYVLQSLAERQSGEIIAVTTKDLRGYVSVSDYSQSPLGDVLIHLAEDSNRSRVAARGLAYEKSMSATLAALLKKGYGRIVYVSSSVLYGDVDSHAHLPVDPIFEVDTYTRVKRRSELAVLALPVGVVVRPTNVYGPGMSPDNVVSTIAKQIPGEGALEVLDKIPVRDFLWVKDAAEGIVASALCPLRKSDVSRVYNLGTGIGSSILDVAAVALDVGQQSQRSVSSLRLTTQRSCLVVDYSDTTSFCGWQPKTSLKQGITHLWKHMKKAHE
jgi:UDP-glucose 4-epimerase